MNIIVKVSGPKVTRKMVSGPWEQTKTGGSFVRKLGKRNTFLKLMGTLKVNEVKLWVVRDKSVIINVRIVI